jgi:hypothetical protein
MSASSLGNMNIFETINIRGGGYLHICTQLGAIRLGHYLFLSLDLLHFLLSVDSSKCTIKRRAIIWYKPKNNCCNLKLGGRIAGGFRLGSMGVVVCQSRTYR